MSPDQAAGYIFEEIVMKMLVKSGYVQVHQKRLKGRGAYHQIDAYGTLALPTPFINPIRLICEAKCRQQRTGLSEIRSFYGAVKDISEKYVTTKGPRGNRWTDSGSFFSINGFTKDAQDFAWAHNIYLVPFSLIPGFNTVQNRIVSLLEENAGRLSRMTKPRLSALSTELVQDVTNGTIVVGVLDDAYPVLIFSNGDLNSYLQTRLNGDYEIDAHKSGRRDAKYGSLFTVKFTDALVGYFELPSVVANRVIGKVNNSQPTDIIAKLDVPVVVAESRRKAFLRVNIFRN